MNAMLQKTPAFISEKTSTAFWICLIATIFLGLVAPRTLAFLPAIMGLGFALTAAKKEIWRPKKEELALFLTTIFLAFISSFWAPDQNFGIERSIKIAITILPGLLLLNLARQIKWPKKRPVIPILISLHVIISVFFITEKLSDHQILEFILGKEINSFKLNRSFVVFVLFSLPLLFLTQTENFEKMKKISLFVFVSIVTVLALSVTESQTAQLTFATGLFFLLLFPIKHRFTFKALTTFIILTTLLLPFAIKPLQSALPERILIETPLKHASMPHRLEVWSYAADKALESPIYGNGIEALRFMKADEWMKHQKSYNALHAHNVILQIWAEFGLLGIFLGIVFLLYLFRSISRTENPETKRLYLTMFMSCFCVSLTGYGFWQGWQLGLFILIAGFSLAIGNNQKKIKES